MKNNKDRSSAEGSIKLAVVAPWSYPISPLHVVNGRLLMPDEIITTRKRIAKMKAFPVVFVGQPDPRDLRGSEKLEHWEASLIQEIGLESAVLLGPPTSRDTTCPDRDDCGRDD
jgi:hypothetical protein